MPDGQVAVVIADHVEERDTKEAHNHWLVAQDAARGHAEGLGAVR